MARSWVLDSRSIAKKVRNASLSSGPDNIKDYGANRECPNCHFRIDNSDVSHEWPGLPAGIKFDPSEEELLEHLAAKCGVGNSTPHMFIDEFIPTLENDQGICYTHPENLPGIKKDGSSIHFFHRTSNAYATGQRKRRRIQSEGNLKGEHERWHKTGKSKPVIENGVHKGWKKIMVLYKKSKKGSKPDKSGWVIHQYHLGTEAEEKHGDYVVSKVFYQQQKQKDKNDHSPIIEEKESLMLLRASPRTPKTNPPNPPRPWKSEVYDDVTEDNVLLASPQGAEFAAEASSSIDPPAVRLEDDLEYYPPWLAGESQAVENPDLNGFDDTLLCKENFNSSSLSKNHTSCTGGAQTTNEMAANNNDSGGLSELANLDFALPDFRLSDLQFDSQDSVFGWLDR